MIERKKKILGAAGLSMSALLLVSCGGASDSVGKCYSPNPAVCSAVGVNRSFPDPQANSSIAGLYKGLTSNGRTIGSLVLDDNSFYTIYSQVNNPNIAAGVVQGTVRSNNGSFSITDAIDVNLEGLGTQVAYVSGSYGEKQFLSGSMSYPASNQSVSFTANYSSDYEITPNISTVAGSYAGTSGGTIGFEALTFDISGAGDISGKGRSGCTFSGSIKARSSGNAYMVDIVFGTSPCRFPGAKLTGISYFDRSSNTTYTIASLPGQTASFVAIATKQ